MRGNTSLSFAAGILVSNAGNGVPSPTIKVTAVKATEGLRCSLVRWVSAALHIDRSHPARRRRLCIHHLYFLPGQRRGWTGLAFAHLPR